MLKTSLNFDQGRIVVADILFSEQIGVKRRPVLIISNSEFNSHSEDLVVLKITSADKKTEFDILLSNNDLVSGALKKDSFIMADFPATVSKKLITITDAKISAEKLAEVKKKMKSLFAI